MTVAYFFLEPPYQYFVIDHDLSNIVKQGEVEALESIASLVKTYDEAIGIIPGEQVNILDVEIPVRVRKKALQAIPFVLEDKLVGDIEDIQFFLLDWKPKKISTVAIIQKEKWFSYLHWIESSGIEVKSIIPDYNLLSLNNDESATLFLEEKTKRILLKFLQEDLTKGLVIYQEELPYWLDEFNSQGKKIVCNDENILFELMNAETINTEIVQNSSITKIEEVCLESGGYKSFVPLQLYNNSDIIKKGFEKNKLWFIFSIIFLGLALLMNVGFDIYEYTTLKSEELVLEKRIEDIFKSSFPNIDKIVDAQLQFQREIETLKGNTKGSQEFLFLVDKVLTSLPRQVTFIDELYYRNSALDVSFKVNNFQILDEFSTQLGKINSVKFERISSDSQGGKVFAKYRFSVLEK